MSVYLSRENEIACMYIYIHCLVHVFLAKIISVCKVNALKHASNYWIFRAGNLLTFEGDDSTKRIFLSWGGGWEAMILKVTAGFQEKKKQSPAALWGGW